MIVGLSSCYELLFELGVVHFLYLFLLLLGQVELLLLFIVLGIVFLLILLYLFLGVHVHFIYDVVVHHQDVDIIGYWLSCVRPIVLVSSLGIFSFMLNFIVSIAFIIILFDFFLFICLDFLYMFILFLLRLRFFITALYFYCYCFLLLQNSSLFFLVKFLFF